MTTLRNRLALGSALCAAALSCQSEPTPVELVVYSWWEESSEHRAFDGVATLHRESFPHVTLDNRAIAEADNARRALTARMLAGAPPATFQANSGADVLRWTAVDSVEDGELRQDSRIVDLSAQYSAWGLADAVPDVVERALRRGGAGIYAIPINVHRLNVVYYDTEKRDEFRRVTGNELLELATLCPEAPLPAGEEQTRVLQIAIGTEDPFPLYLLAFESVLPALAGAEFYERFWSGGLSETEWEPELRRALSCVQYLARFFIPSHDTLLWYEAVDLVGSQATLTVMGDWAGARIGAAPRIASAPFPGTEELYVFTSDTFPLPAGLEHEAEAIDLLHTIASPQAQIAFSRKKGSLPARVDIDARLLDAAMLEKRAAFEASSKLLATSGYFPPYFPFDMLESRMKALIAAGSGSDELDAVLALWRDAYPLLARWQTRMAAPEAGKP